MKWASSARIAKTARRSSRGFALATVLIASTVMLTVLIVSVRGTSAARTSLQGQYYNSLARTAAESGIAYAKACLAANATNPGAPTWTSANPLQVNTGCDGKVPSGNPACVASANIDTCTVSSNGNVVSNFSVPIPTVDSTTGDATSVSATGIVYILKSSQVNTSTAPWRTYKVTISANLVTPNLCSPYNTATTGWSNVSAYQPTVHSISGSPAYKISPTADSTDLPGIYYYETSFSLATTGTYSLQQIGDDRGEVSIDGVLAAVSTGTVSTNSISLSSGCHTVVAKIMNGGFAKNSTGITLSLRLNGATSDALFTESDDTKWRVIKGSVVNFSQINYFDDQVAAWSPVRVIANYAAASAWAAPTNWTSLGGDTHANWINSTSTLAGYNQPYSASTAYPSAMYMEMRDSQSFTTVGTDPVKLITACDDQCTLYIDGNPVLSNSSSTTATTVTLTNLTAGQHEAAVLLYNNTAASGFLFSAYDTTTNVSLVRSDASWETDNNWDTTAGTPPQSYDDSFMPSNLPTAASGAVYPSITNLATNPSFETSTANTNARSTTLSVSNSFHSSGTSSLSVLPNSASINDSSAGVGLDSGNGLQLGMIAGHQYVLSATVRIPTALSGTLDPNGRIAALSFWYFETGYNTAIYTMASPVNVAGTYNLSLTVHLPTDATQAYIRLYNGALSAGGVVYWDSVSLTDITNGPAPSSYHDGTTALYPGWAYTGTSQLSTSIGPYLP